MPHRPALLPSLLCAALLSSCAATAPASPQRQRPPEAPRPAWTAVAPMPAAR
jgi:hypothetical protein